MHVRINEAKVSSVVWLWPGDCNDHDRGQPLLAEEAEFVKLGCLGKVMAVQN